MRLCLDHRWFGPISVLGFVCDLIWCLAAADNIYAFWHLALCKTISSLHQDNFDSFSNVSSLFGSDYTSDDTAKNVICFYLLIYESRIWSSEIWSSFYSLLEGNIAINAAAGSLMWRHFGDINLVEISNVGHVCSVKRVCWLWCGTLVQRCLT